MKKSSNRILCIFSPAEVVLAGLFTNHTTKMDLPKNYPVELDRLITQLSSKNYNLLNWDDHPINGLYLYLSNEGKVHVLRIVNGDIWELASNDFVLRKMVEKIVFESSNNKDSVVDSQWLYEFK